MMVQHTCSIGLLLVSAALAAIGLQRTGWLDRVVQYQKEKLFNEIRELAPININAEIRPKPEGYNDSEHWDYDSVLRLLTLIRGSETAKPVLKALRRMLQPTRRIMMSMKESMQRFPSIKKDDNEIYYNVDYSSSEDTLPAPPPVPEDQVVLVVSNPVEARLPSARISVKLLRQILEARALAARQMPSTTQKIPWIEFVKNRNTTATDAVRTTKKGKATKATTAADGAGVTPEPIEDATPTPGADGGSEATPPSDGAPPTPGSNDGNTNPPNEGATPTPGADGGGETTPPGEGATPMPGAEATPPGGGPPTPGAEGSTTEAP